MTTPRNVLLIEEFENAMKGKYGPVSFGVLDGDISLKNWQGSIITQKGDIFEFNFICNENFPNSPPELYFNKNILDKGNLLKICNNDGKIKEDIIKKLNWNNKTSIGEYLLNIKKFLDI